MTVLNKEPSKKEVADMLKAVWKKLWQYIEKML